LAVVTSDNPFNIQKFGIVCSDGIKDQISRRDI